MAIIIDRKSKRRKYFSFAFAIIGIVIVLSSATGVTGNVIGISVGNTLGGIVGVAFIATALFFRLKER